MLGVGLLNRLLGRDGDDTDACDHEFAVESPEERRVSLAMHVIDDALHIEHRREAREVCVHCGVQNRQYAAWPSYVVTDSWRIPQEEYGGDLPPDVQRVGDWRGREGDRAMEDD